MLFVSAATAQSYLNETGEACPEGFVAAGDYCYTSADYEAIQTGVCEGTPTNEAFLACLAETNVSETIPAPASTPAAVGCEGFISAAGNPSQFQAQQFYDFNATPEEQAILDPDGNGLACDKGAVGSGSDPAEVSGSGSEEASASYATLPDTGGTSLLLTFSALLAGGGLLSLKLRR